MELDSATISKDEELSTIEILAVTLMYMSFPDGDIENATEEEKEFELAYLSVTLKYASGVKNLVDVVDLNKIAEHCSSKSPQEFAKNIAGILDEKQQLVVLMHLVEILYADGEADNDEQEMLNIFTIAFEVDTRVINNYMECVSLRKYKNLFL